MGELEYGETEGRHLEANVGTRIPLLVAQVSPGPSVNSHLPSLQCSHTQRHTFGECVLT